MDLKRKRRRADREHLRELYRRIVAWDPIGLIATGAPEDEYDCLLGPIATDLRDEVTPAHLAEVLRLRITSHFGVEPENTERFAVEITDWHRIRRSN